MADCDYCEQSFPDEGSLLEHMGEAHEGELGRIDQRRVADHRGDGGTELSTTIGYAVIGIVFVAVIGGAVYVAVGAFSESPPERIHEHGTINMTVEGERIAFASSQYTTPTDFHFHGSGPEWHMHPSPPERLTLAEAMGRLGIELTENSITVEGETYNASDPGTNLTIEVNGESVDPATYELHGSGPNPQEGDHIRIVVETEN
ncbi:hypothetical protein GCM10028857_27300 [Salinarchaeum chitinilyticum]